MPRSKTYDEVQAALLNSERHPDVEVQDAFDAVVKFAFSECDKSLPELLTMVANAFGKAETEAANE